MKARAILAVIALFGIPILFFIASNFFPKRYTAVAKILISAPTGPRMDSGPLGALDDISNFSGARSANTQIDVITGTDVLREAIIRTQAKLPGKFPPGKNVNQQFEELARLLVVDSDKESDVLYLRVTNQDPELAAEFANEIGYSYIDFARQLSKESATAALTAMRDQLRISKAALVNIDKQQADLKVGAKAADIASLSASTGSNQIQSSQRYSEIKGMHDGTVQELRSARSLLQEIPRTTMSSSSVQINPVLSTLQIEEIRARTELADLRTKYQDDFPDVIAARGKLRDLQRSMAKLKPMVDAGNNTTPNPVYINQLTTVSSLEGKIGNLREQMLAAKAQLDDSASRVGSLTDTQRKMAALERDRIVQEQNYLQVEQRKQITEALGTARQSTARMVSTAISPSSPSFPDPRIFILAGLAVGIFTAVLLLMPRNSDVVPTRGLMNDLDSGPRHSSLDFEKGDVKKDTDILPKSDDL